MQKDKSPVNADLVLVGGGHSHVFVLRHLAMNPVPGFRVTLVTRDLHTPYSGMLPGYIAGHYAFDDAHIDLLPLAQLAGARVIHDSVTGIDAERCRIGFAHRPPLDYDLLSINIGSRPSSPLGQDDDGRQFAVKPVDRFIESWRRLEQHLLGRDGDFRMAIIGGGAGGIELALSLEYRSRQLAQGSAGLSLSILTADERLLPGHNERVRRIFARILEQRSIPVHYRHAVEKFENGRLHGNFESPIAADGAIWVTHASAPGWLRDSGLKLDERGFIAVNACLQSVSHANVFAAGDIASVEAYPRPKSGVFAVRQGIPLARNLIRHMRQQSLEPFRPQRQFLSLISTGERHAVASRGPWALQGRWCWWLKDRIDRGFIRRFSELPDMSTDDPESPDLAPMRCGGCGSKVGSEILERVLEEVYRDHGIDPDSGLEHPDDAALIAVPAGMELLQSIDHFRSFIDDPYLFGRIAANHALGDLFAMGVDAHSALVIANVEVASETKQAQDLYQLMSGVIETLNRHRTRLLGGHSGEAAQMSCGLSVNGFARPQDLLLKSGMQAEDLLILTKPLGSGVLFAASMRGRARGEWIDTALRQMMVSSQDAAHCLRRFGASACTDVTGFGFAGHLLEMARASGCAVEILVERLPLYPGAAVLAGEGIASSLQPQNIRIRHSIDDRLRLASHPAYPVMFDPQTAGGLLASVAPDRAEQCLQALLELGYGQACIVGRVLDRADSRRILRLVNS